LKLRMERIEYLANLIVTALIDEKLLLVDDKESTMAIARRLIVDDLRVEDDLDEEVRAILRDHATEIEKERIPYHQMFRVVKEKLVKERNLIL
jgi:uncharacterized protein